MKIVIVLAVVTSMALANNSTVEFEDVSSLADSERPETSESDSRSGLSIGLSGLPLVSDLLGSLQNQPANKKTPGSKAKVSKATTKSPQVSQEDEDWDSVESTTQGKANINRFYMDPGGPLRVRINQPASSPGKLPQRFVIYKAKRVSIEPKVASVLDSKRKRIYIPFNEVHVIGLFNGEPMDKAFDSAKGNIEILKEPHLRPGVPDPDD